MALGTDNMVGRLSGREAGVMLAPVQVMETLDPMPPHYPFGWMRT